MSQIKYYWYKLKYRLTHLRGGMDYLLLAVTGLNLWFFIQALMVGNIVGMLINGLFFAWCFRGLIY